MTHRPLPHTHRPGHASRQRSGLAFLVFLAQAVACGDPVGPTFPDLVGVWQAIEVSSLDEEASERVNLIDEGLRMTITIANDGSMTWWSREEPIGAESESIGTIRLEGTRFTILIDAETLTGSIHLAGRRLTLDFDPVDYFGGAVRFRMVFRRS